MKKALAILLVLVMALAAFGCAPKEAAAPAAEAPAAEAAAPAAEAEAPAAEATEAPAEEAKNWTIGYDNNGLANFFARAGKAAAEDEIAKLGCTIIHTVSEDTTTRTATIENFVLQGVDAIIIEEGDVNEVRPALEDAKAAGIVIGSMDGGYIEGVTDVYVSSDNVKLGEAVGKMLVEYCGEEAQLLEVISESGSMIRARMEGVYSVTSQYPGIKFLYSFAYNWPDFYEDIKKKVESAIQASPNPGDIDGVFASFDGVGVAACDAFMEAGFTGETVSIVGVDGDPDAYEMMKKENSPYKATIAQDPDTIARTTVQKVVDILNGVDIGESQIFIPGVVITKDNIPAEY